MPYPSLRENNGVGWGLVDSEVVATSELLYDGMFTLGDAIRLAYESGGKDYDY